MLLREAEGAHRDQFNKTMPSNRGGKALLLDTAASKKYSPYMSKTNAP